MLEIVVLHLIVKRRLVIALLIQHNPGIRSRCPGGEQIVRIDLRLSLPVLIVCMANDQRSPSEIGFGHAKVLTEAIDVIRNDQLVIPVERVDILLQLEPQRHRIAQRLDEYGRIRAAVHNTRKAAHQEPAHPPAEVPVLSRDGIRFGVAGVHARVYSLRPEVIHGNAQLIKAALELRHAVTVLPQLLVDLHRRFVIARLLTGQRNRIPARTSLLFAVLVVSEHFKQLQRFLVLLRLLMKQRLPVPALLRAHHAVVVRTQRLIQIRSPGVLSCRFQFGCLNRPFIREIRAADAHVKQQRRADSQLVRNGPGAEASTHIHITRFILILAGRAQPPIRLTDADGRDPQKARALLPRIGCSRQLAHFLRLKIAVGLRVTQQKDAVLRFITRIRHPFVVCFLPIAHGGLYNRGALFIRKGCVQEFPVEPFPKAAFAPAHIRLAGVVRLTVKGIPADQQRLPLILGENQPLDRLCAVIGLIVLLIATEHHH